MRSPVAILLICMTGLWAALAYPAWRLGGQAALLACSAAAVLAAVPACLNLLWAGARFHQLSPSQRFQWMLLAKMLRTGLVLGGGVALYLLVPGLGQLSFWVWVLVFYTPALALETMLLLPQTGPSVSLQLGPRKSAAEETGAPSLTSAPAQEG